MAQIEKKQRQEELNQATLLRILQDVYTESEHTPSLEATDIIRQLTVHLEPFFNSKTHNTSIQSSQ